MEMFQINTINDDERAIRGRYYAMILATMLCITASAMKPDVGDPIGTPMFCLQYSNMQKLFKQ